MISMLASNLWRGDKSVHGARCPSCQTLASILIKPDGSERVCCKHFNRMEPERPARDSVVRFYFDPCVEDEADVAPSAA